MECDVACQQLSSWLDGQLSSAEAQALEAHLATCSECRSLADAWRLQDAELRQAFLPQRQAAERVAAEVLKQLDSEAHAARAATGFRSHWGSLLLAAAAGFLLAVLLFQPWRKGATVVQPGENTASAAPRREPPIARLVVATGGIDMRMPGADAWTSWAEPAGLACNSGSVIRTGPDTRCELSTTEGCIIRLNTDTEITLASSNAVEVQQGQIWCSSPENVSLKISAPQSGATAQTPRASAWWAACPSNSCVITEVRREGEVQVTTAGGETQLQTPHESQRLARGESASIIDGQIVMSGRSLDPVLAQGWIHPLLVRKGHGNEGLTQRVDQLLAHMGQSKVTFLYEQEIRGFGEFAALPLLRYVQSPLSLDEPARRQTAMRILCDIAPSWVVPDLIGLLSDTTPWIRVLSARALERLTGLDQGRPPEQWRDDLNDCKPAIESWQQWWAENNDEYSRPASIPAGVKPNSSAASGQAIGNLDLI